eukprot:9602402-Alexandrium_andersonii.AAC.1
MELLVASVAGFAYARSDQEPVGSKATKGSVSGSQPVASPSVSCVALPQQLSSLTAEEFAKCTLQDVAP